MGLMIPHSYTVDIANGTKKEKITNALIYGDADSHEVTVTVLSGGITAVMTGYSGILYAVRMADKVTIPNEATIVGNVVTAKLAQGCLLARGRVDLLLTLTKDGDSVSPLWVEATCAGGITDTIADPAEIIPTLSDLFAQISAMENATAAVAAATATANAAASAAEAAADAADIATENASSAAQRIDNMTVAAVEVPNSGDPTVQVELSGGAYRMTFGLKTGAAGRDGVVGELADGMYLMTVDDAGDLIVTYNGAAAPPLSIDANGDLIYTI